MAWGIQVTYRMFGFQGDQVAHTNRTGYLICPCWSPIRSDLLRRAGKLSEMPSKLLSMSRFVVAFEFRKCQVQVPSQIRNHRSLRGDSSTHLRNHDGSPGGRATADTDLSVCG